VINNELTKDTLNQDLNQDDDDFINGVSFVDFDADSVYYSMSVGDFDKYFINKKNELTYLVTREVMVGDVNFGGFQAVKMNEAIDYYKSMNQNNERTALNLVTKISIKEKDGRFDAVWSYSNPISITDVGYGVFELKIYLEESYARYNGKLQSRLHINFKTVDYDDGYKLYTLSYFFNKNQWELVQRERICTIQKDINNEHFGYCKDTINDRIQITSNKFKLEYNHVFNFNNAICF
jgi:hypothetical protein